MLMRKCPKCGKYNLKRKCCETTINPHPRRFSLEKERKYSKYRKALKT